jgi:hypothetical protein
VLQEALRPSSPTPPDAPPSSRSSPANPRTTIPAGWRSATSQAGRSLASSCRRPACTTWPSRLRSRPCSSTVAAARESRPMTFRPELSWTPGHRGLDFPAARHRRRTHRLPRRRRDSNPSHRHRRHAAPASSSGHVALHDRASSDRRQPRRLARAEPRTHPHLPADPSVARDCDTSQTTVRFSRPPADAPRNTRAPSSSSSAARR